MGAFNTKELLNGSPTLIPTIADKIVNYFQVQEYEISVDNLNNGGCEISISKGNIFKAILGMKTALKISLTPQGNSIVFEASVGIFGKQVIPTLIMWYVAWPVLLTQIWGLVQQSKLDDEALKIAKTVIAENKPATIETYDHKFCTSCGTKNNETANFCCKCGRPL